VILFLQVINFEGGRDGIDIGLRGIEIIEIFFTDMSVCWVVMLLQTGLILLDCGSTFFIKGEFRGRHDHELGLPVFIATAFKVEDLSERRRNAFRLATKIMDTNGAWFGDIDTCHALAIPVASALGFKAFIKPLCFLKTCFFFSCFHLSSHQLQILSFRFASDLVDFCVLDAAGYE